jgi:hypothetical protein
MREALRFREGGGSAVDGRPVANPGGDLGSRLLERRPQAGDQVLGRTIERWTARLMAATASPVWARTGTAIERRS